ncbi:hypothetical protein llap_21629 [Limosa lapponica baueri]|uniref:VWFD domain-containing protein n=1 Tax=Limosa lapponica baueri TaxID=1758121 RepID=A0A2I0T2P4_LIMLA|nr:hypothetical protein llap_21629 [Limosa lapponica baueri]
MVSILTMTRCPTMTMVSHPTMTMISHPTMTTMSHPTMTMVSIPTVTMASILTKTRYLIPTMTTMSIPTMTMVSILTMPRCPTMTMISHPTMTMSYIPTMTMVSILTMTRCPTMTMISHPTMTMSYIPTMTMNSNYTTCGPACPTTCNPTAVPTDCPTSACVETCSCQEGFLLEANQCIPQDQCGCLHEGLLHGLHEEFWGDTTCTKRCVCDGTSQKAVCREDNCQDGEECRVEEGIQGCYPKSQGTCTAVGATHYETFDGGRFVFQGTCVYQMVGLCEKTPGLVDFQSTAKPSASTGNTPAKSR